MMGSMFGQKETPDDGGAESMIVVSMPCMYSSTSLVGMNG